MLRKLSGIAIFLMIVAAGVVAITFLPQAYAGDYSNNYGLPCVTSSANPDDPALGEFRDGKCFKTASGYTFRIIESGTCGEAGAVTGFPTPKEGKNLWCFETVASNLKVSALNQVTLQIPLSFYDFNSTTTIATPLLTPINSLASQFSFSKANGCLGDSSSGFEVGDIQDCGLKWVLRLNPGGGAPRFYFYSPGNITVEVGPKIMAPKVGNVLEPGIILAPRALLNAAPWTPQAQYMCHEIGGNFYKIPMDDYGCPSGSLENCGNTEYRCQTTCSPVDDMPPVKVGFYLKNPDGSPDFNTELMPPKTMREIGDLFGTRVCPSGQMTNKKNPTYTWLYLGGTWKKVCVSDCGIP